MFMFFRKKKPTAAHDWKRTVIVHYHLFKNAGTSVDNILRKSFPGRTGGLEGTDPWSAVSQETIGEYILSNHCILSVSTHQGSLPPPSLPGIRIIPLFFLRNPMERLGSVYFFHKRFSGISSDEGIRIAQRGTIQDYFTFRLSIPKYRKTISDFHTRFLSGTSEPFLARDHFERAKLHLNLLDCFGLVEEFKESLRRYRCLCAEFGLSLADSKKRMNVSEERGSTLDDRIGNLRMLVGDTLWKDLIAANSYDIELYEWARKLFLGNASILRRNNGC